MHHSHHSHQQHQQQEQRLHVRRHWGRTQLLAAEGTHGPQRARAGCTGRPTIRPRAQGRGVPEVCAKGTAIVSTIDGRVCLQGRDRALRVPSRRLGVACPNLVNDELTRAQWARFVLQDSVYPCGYLALIASDLSIRYEVSGVS